MASRIIKFFFDTEKLAETNAKYKARISEINEKDANVKEAIRNAKAANKAAFLAELHANTAKRNAQLKSGRY